MIGLYSKLKQRTLVRRPKFQKMRLTTVTMATELTHKQTKYSKQLQLTNTDSYMLQGIQIQRSLESQMETPNYEKCSLQRLIGG